LNAPDREAEPADLSFDGWRIERHAQLGSTSDEARERALAGDPGHLWIWADEQTAGRGRHGRVWRSPPGNLHASALILGPCETEIAPQIGFVAGAALLSAVRDLGGADVRLKWPNDLVSNGAKLAGLLVEGVTTPRQRFAAVIGFGVNLAISPPGLPYPVTHLSHLLERPVGPEDLFPRLARRFDEALALWARGAGFAAIREEWLASAAGLRGPIHVSGPRGAREGVFEGIDPQGRLLLRSGDSVELIESADLTLIPSSALPGDSSSAPSLLLKAAPHD
jgi:BirA family biotin operon repressor/biotin-[acetyl-CoA-carboxylase] ligase